MIEKFEVRIKSPLLALNEDPLVTAIVVAEREGTIAGWFCRTAEGLPGVVIEESQLGAMEE